MDDQDENINMIATTSYSTDYFTNENRVLKTQVCFLTTENANLKQEIYRLNNVINSKNDELVVIDTKLSRLEKFNTDLTSKNKNYKEEIEALQKELEKLIEDSRNKVSHLNEMTKENNLLGSNLIILKKENSQKLLEIENYLQELRKFNVEKLNFTNENLTLASELSNERTKITNLNQSLEMKKNQLLSQENNFCLEIKSLQDQIQHVNSHLSLVKEESINKEQSLNLRIYELSSENRNLKMQNENSELRLNEAVLNLELKDRKIDELANIINEFQRHIKQQEKETELLKDLINDKENEIKSLYSVKRRLDEYTRIEKNFEVISYTDIELLKEDFKKISSLYQTAKKDLETAIGNNEKYREDLQDYNNVIDKYERISTQENDNLKEYFDLLPRYEKMNKEFSELQRDVEILNEFADKMSKQNRELLMEIRLREGRNSFVSQNLGKKQYEEFLYTNINDLEAKFSELTKRNIAVTRDRNNLQAQYDNTSRTLKEKEDIILTLEAYIKENEGVISNLKKEFDLLKYYSQSHYSLFTLKFSDRNQNEVKGIQQLQSQLESAQIFISTLTLEKEKLTKNASDLDLKNNSLTADNLKLRNQILGKEKELNDKNKMLNELNKIRANDENLINSIKAENSTLKSQNEQVNFMSQNLFREKEKLIENLRITVDQINRQLNETQGSVKEQLNRLGRENETLKEILSLIQKDIINISQSVTAAESGLVKAAEINISESSVENQIKAEFSLLKEKLGKKEKEYLKLKERRTELEIKLENISTENSSLKFQNDFLENRIKYYQNLLNESPLNINRNIPNIQDINAEMIQQDEQLYQKYLECLKSIERLTSENKLLISKCNGLDTLNKQLVRNDIGAPYKYLFNKIENLNNLNTQLENEKLNLITEKENILKDYAFINLNSESFKRNLESSQRMIQELNEKIEEQRDNLSLYAESQTVIEEKNRLIDYLQNQINKFVQEKLELENKIKSGEDLLIEKDTQVKESQSKVDAITEAKNKEVGESKAKYFKMFYLSFKKARSVIQVLIKLKETLEEKIGSLDKGNDAFLDRDYNEISNKMTQYEQTISGLRKKIKEIEENNKGLVNSLNKELELQRDKERNLLNDIKSFKNIHTFEGSVDMKPHFIKLLKSLTSAMNIIKFKDVKVSQLEDEIKASQSHITQLEADRNVIDLAKTCEKCEVLSMEVNSLSNVNREFNVRLRKQESDKDNLNSQLTKTQLENELRARELKGLSECLKQPEEIGGKPQNEKNKIFSQLLNQMRRATKIISLLERHIKNLEIV